MIMKNQFHLHIQITATRLKYIYIIKKKSICVTGYLKNPEVLWF